jgi:rhamnogalacturonan endolyase
MRRRFYSLRTFILALGLCSLISHNALAQRQMEKLGRGVVAVVQSDGKVWVGWRMLGTDPDDIAFNVYRADGAAEPAKLNPQPVKNVTDFVDPQPKLDQATTYFVRPVIDGKEQADSGRFKLPANAKPMPYLSVPLQTPAGHSPNDASVGDLDGDGEYDIVIHMSGRGRDNSQAGVTGTAILQGYKLDGTLLWTIDLGKNIREGAHYTQFMIYDLDGDGRAEIVCKTADGTIDGKGKIIGDAKADWRNDRGYILSGPEYLNVFDGLTGEALATTNYLPARGIDKEDPTTDELKQLWGDGYGNRCDRFLAGVAYLDGVHPSVVMCRGYYTRTFLVAWDWRDGKLTHRWTFDSAQPGNQKYAGQGHHQLSVADVDGDGKDEIIYGDMCVNADGTGRYTTECGHGDTLHVSDLDPEHPGLEVFSIQERFDDAGAHMFDANTGKILWKKPSVKAATSGGDKGEGPGRGVCFDVDPRYPGMESWALGAGMQGVWNAKGEEIGQIKPGSCNFAVWWDGDVLRELLDRNHIDKWNWEKQTTDRIVTADGCTSCNGTKATPSLSADILGDWREEVIWPTTDGKELRIYTTTIPTDRRFYTFMHDPQYRLAIAWQNVAYNQPPHPSFYVGEGMKPPPRPKIVLIEPKGK